MNVEAIMTRDIKSCRPVDSCADAARIMWDRDCGCVPVVDDRGRVQAMITDRDICMAALTRGRPLEDIRVGEAMSRALFAVSMLDSVETAQKTMRDRQVRRLPVVDGDNRLVGVITVNDIVRAASRTPATRAGMGLTPTAIETTLAAIGAHRGDGHASAP